MGVQETHEYSRLSCPRMCEFRRVRARTSAQGTVLEPRVQATHAQHHDRDSEEAALDAEEVLPADQEPPEVAKSGEAPFHLIPDTGTDTRLWARRPGVPAWVSNSPGVALAGYTSLKRGGAG
jgi:hypothetical protein